MVYPLKKNKYKIGEPIDGTFYIKNISKNNVKIIGRPHRLRDWNFVISGPQGGNYHWKGPIPKYVRISEDDFIWLKPNEVHKVIVSPGGQIEQKVKAGGGDFSTVLPGRYYIKIIMGNMSTGTVEIEISK